MILSRLWLGNRIAKYYIVFDDFPSAEGLIFGARIMT